MVFLLATVKRSRLLNEGVLLLVTVDNIVEGIISRAKAEADMTENLSEVKSEDDQKNSNEVTSSPEKSAESETETQKDVASENAETGLAAKDDAGEGDDDTKKEQGERLWKSKVASEVFEESFADFLVNTNGDKNDEKGW